MGVFEEYYTQFDRLELSLVWHSGANMNGVQEARFQIPPARPLRTLINKASAPRHDFGRLFSTLI